MHHSPHIASIDAVGDRGGDPARVRRCSRRSTTKLGGADSVGYLQVYGLMAVMGVVSILAIQALVSVAIFNYFRTHHKEEHHWWTTITAPVIGDDQPGVRAVPGDQATSTSSAPGYGYAKWLCWGDLAIFLVGLGYAFYVKSQRPSEVRDGRPDDQSRDGHGLNGLQQKDNLCGPFQAARVLRDAGISSWDGDALDQDLVALHAGTVLPAHAVGPQVPPGAANLVEYRYELRLGSSDERTGTRACALADTIATLSGGRLECVPLTGAWTGAAVERLVDDGARLGAGLIANLRTGRLWGSHPPLELLLGWLDRGEPPDGMSAPAADWDTGHFVGLEQVVRGRAGALVVVRDSYPTLGWDGWHVQPPEVLAQALMRGDGRRGGVLCIVGSERAWAATELAASLGLDTAIWNNERQE